jgi:hypothetical protein
MLAGRLPFTMAGGENLYAAVMRQVTAPLPPLGVDLPEGAEGLVRRVLAKDPEERPAARALADELRAFRS